MGHGSFGFTVKADATGDAEFDSDTKTLRTAEGVAALRQDTIHRFLTIQGEDPVFPTAGLPLLEFFSGRFDRRLIKERVREQILADPRVQSVTEVIVGDPDDDRRVEISARGIAVDQSTFLASSLATLR